MLKKRSMPARSTALALVAALLLMAAISPLDGAAALEDQWYKQQAQVQLDELRELLHDATYIGTVGSLPEAQQQMSQWRKALDEQKPAVHLFAMPTIEDVIRASGQGDLFAAFRGLGEVARRRMEALSFSMLLNHLASAADSSIGALVAANALASSTLVEKPEGFAETVLVYEYDDLAVAVAFLDAQLAVSVQTYVSRPALLDMLGHMQ